MSLGIFLSLGSQLCLTPCWLYSADGLSSCVKMVTASNLRISFFQLNKSLETSFLSFILQEGPLTDLLGSMSINEPINIEFSAWVAWDTF